MTEHAVRRTPKSTDLDKLHIVIEDIDAIAHGGFSGIAAIAKLALAALQTPGGYRDPENIVQALKVIWDKAQDVQNLINCEAESVGCNHKNEELDQRWDARRAAQTEKHEKPQCIEADKPEPEPDLKTVH